MRFLKKTIMHFMGKLGESGGGVKRLVSNRDIRYIYAGRTLSGSDPMKYT